MITVNDFLNHGAKNISGNFEIECYPFTITLRSREKKELSLFKI